MQLVTEMLAVFDGGDVAFTNVDENRLYRGQVRSAVVNRDNTLRITLEWLARNNGSRTRPTKRWTKVQDSGDLVMKLEECIVTVAGFGRIQVNATMLDTIFILHPYGGSKLKPENVEGLGNAA